MISHKTVAALLFGFAVVGGCFFATPELSAASADNAAPAKPAASAPEAVTAKPSSSTPKGLHFAAEIPGFAEELDHALKVYKQYPQQTEPTAAERANLVVLPPIACYTVSAEDVVGGKGLAAPKLDYLLYYIRVSGRAAAEIRISANREGTAAAPSGANIREYVVESDADDGEVFLARVDQVKSLEQVRQGSFELRILRLPPYDKRSTVTSLPTYISSFVFWLKSDTPGSDLIYTLPFDGQEPGLQPSTVYTVPEMLKLIRPAVKACLEAPDPPRIETPFSSIREAIQASQTTEARAPSP